MPEADDYELEIAATLWGEVPETARQLIPAHLQGGLDRYFAARILPGDFLQCVLSMELEAVVRCTDNATLLSLPLLIQTLHTWAPTQAWGSRKKVVEWCSAPGPVSFRVVEGEKRGS